MVAGGTFKVDQAVPVEVNVLKDLVHLPLGEALPQQDLEGCPELAQADAAIPIGVKLWQRGIIQSPSPSLPHHTQQAPPALSPGPHLSEGIPQLPDANHVCRLGQHLGAHQLHKVFKVHLPATWGPCSSEIPSWPWPWPSSAPALPFWPGPSNCALLSPGPTGGAICGFDDFP